jgi:4-nitrophenyl phosphatase
LTSVISTATQTEPIFIGKPEPIMINMILEERGIDRSEVLMIGDNYETDILTGIHAGIDTAIVFTGYTSPEDLRKKEEQPTYQWQHLLEWKQDIDES